MRNDFVTELLDGHNKLREEFGRVPPLELNEDLSKLAQEHVNALAESESKLKNSENEEVGENLYYLESADGHYSAQQVINFWLKRSEFNREQKPSTTNHFTQMVWKTSTKLGVGVAKAKNGAVYVAAFYTPRGNVTKKLDENVIFEIKNKPSLSENILKSLDTLMKRVDRDKSGKVSLTKSKKLFHLINEKFNTSFSSTDAKKLFEKFKDRPEGKVEIEEFKKEFFHLASSIEAVGV
jgi:hypothetical protein